MRVLVVSLALVGGEALSGGEALVGGEASIVVARVENARVVHRARIETQRLPRDCEPPTSAYGAAFRLMTVD